jgi:hypothetical protein
VVLEIESQRIEMKLLVERPSESIGCNELTTYK